MIHLLNAPRSGSCNLVREAEGVEQARQLCTQSGVCGGSGSCRFELVTRAEAARSNIAASSLWPSNRATTAGDFPSCGEWNTWQANRTANQKVCMVAAGWLYHLQQQSMCGEVAAAPYAGMALAAPWA
jgi:hypothetical protein